MELRHSEVSNMNKVLGIEADEFTKKQDNEMLQSFASK